MDCGREVGHDTVRCRSCYFVYLKATGGHLGLAGKGPVKRRVIINGIEQIDPRETRSWRKLRDSVIYEEPLCTINLEVCTGWTETADHVIPVIERPDLALTRRNLRGACHACNMRRTAHS